MTNKVIIFEENQQVDIEKRLLKRGLFDFSIIKCGSFDEMLNLAKQNNDDNTLILCKNKHIDKLVEEFASKGNVLSLISEQAVKIQGEGKILIVPLELEIENFLDEFYAQLPVYSCSIFGKSLNFIQEKFDTFDVSYKIITKSKFLHTIYYSKFIDQTIIALAFGESLFGFDDVSLQEACAKLLNGKTLSVAESVTAGLVCGKLHSVNAIKDGKILLTQKDFDAIKMDEIFLEEHGFSKELAYEIAKKLLSSCDIALSIIGGSEGKIFVAVGSKEQIHVYASVFEGEKFDVLEDICEFALFKLFRFLKQN